VFILVILSSIYILHLKILRIHGFNAIIVLQFVRCIPLLAVDFGISDRGYQNYEIGEREPKIETLSNLADYYNVNVDYLIGRTDNPKCQK